ncbi:hypothetical protein SCBWM1_gp172 [Synechococcus phage S-CBWM1]|uniref:Uncharacterized protein n=1 Tax=Synechococcus phage S-CBWM1 TaxID=2053653 RepID=A0A3G1L3V6_9CAUD|nr:hypothetical protein HOU61_gp025 [Synechococcus phage S-CBWM1]ATW62856.1 hypothetical protein SCBWM1_gp172 [Synechococcus phage S-CBWM1]
MAILPVYEKQYIRFAETFHAPTDKETPGANEVAIGAFRVVAQAAYQGAKYACTPGDLDSPGNKTTAMEILGVNQYAVRDAATAPQDNRAISVATSGLLLVEVSPDVGSNSSADTIPVGSALVVDALGRASTADLGATGLVSYILVTKGGTTPIVREHLKTGGSEFVLVSFD